MTTLIIHLRTGETVSFAVNGDSWDGGGAHPRYPFWRNNTSLRLLRVYPEESLRHEFTYESIVSWTYDNRPPQPWLCRCGHANEPTSDPIVFCKECGINRRIGERQARQPESGQPAGAGGGEAAGGRAIPEQPAESEPECYCAPDHSPASAHTREVLKSSCPQHGVKPR